jgi:serine/threonine protein phosphatase PrpC
MTVASRCRWCGAAVSDDGLCGSCSRSTATSSRDHLEYECDRAAGISDRGHVRTRNEDALYIVAPGADVAVVVLCDGVGSAANGDIAAQVAVDAAGRELTTAIQSFDQRLDLAMARAMGIASEAVSAVTPSPSRSARPPAATFVAVAQRGEEIVIGWVGDSRAYWLGPDDPKLLTTDDNWATVQQRTGRLSAAEIAAHPRSRAITGWLGADAPQQPPHVMTFDPASSGRLLVCSDGLWRYMPAVSDLVATVAGIRPRPGAVAACRLLTNIALAAGGHDNITVAIIDIDNAPGAHHG